MKSLGALILIGMFAIGCGGKKKPETTATDPNTSTSNSGTSGGAGSGSGEGTPCEMEIALVCPDGQIDGCLKTPREGDKHACVAK